MSAPLFLKFSSNVQELIFARFSHIMNWKQRIAFPKDLIHPEKEAISMKLMHLSDLHLGKRVNEFSMLEDQEYILDRILEIIDEEQPDGILIAGDVYDKPIPSAEAVKLCSRFLLALAERRLQVFLSSGNHDGAERLAFARELIDGSGVHISPAYDGVVEPFSLADEHGPVDIYMLPFVKPATLRHHFPEAEIVSYTDAVRTAIGHMDMDPSRRNVLLAHQFVTGSEICESEEISVGGSENVDAAVFQSFDYVALGHLHGPQNVARNIRYCGTPLKYSFSEVQHKKSVTLVELGEKGKLTVRTRPLIPKRDLIKIRGTFEELTARSYYEGTGYPDAYVSITLTDEEELPDVVGTLRQIYPYMMQLSFDNTRTRSTQQITADAQIRQKSPLQAFSDLFESQNGQSMSQEQADFMQGVIRSIWEGEV